MYFKVIMFLIYFLFNILKFYLYLLSFLDFEIIFFYIICKIIDLNLLRII